MHNLHWQLLCDLPQAPAPLWTRGASLTKRLVENSFIVRLSLLLWHTVGATQTFKYNNRHSLMTARAGRRPQALLPAANRPTPKGSSIGAWRSGGGPGLCNPPRITAPTPPESKNPIWGRGGRGAGCD